MELLPGAPFLYRCLLPRNLLFKKLKSFVCATAHEDKQLVHTVPPSRPTRGSFKKYACVQCVWAHVCPGGFMRSKDTFVELALHLCLGSRNRLHVRRLQQ